MPFAAMLCTTWYDAVQQFVNATIQQHSRLHQTQHQDSCVDGNTDQQALRKLYPDTEQTCRRAYRDDRKWQHDALQNVEQLIQLVQLMAGLKHNCYDKRGHDGHCSCHTGPLPGSHLEVQEPRHHKLTCTAFTVSLQFVFVVQRMALAVTQHLFQLSKAKVSRSCLQ